MIKLKKISAIVLLMTVLMTAMPINSFVTAGPIGLYIQGSSGRTVEQGGTISFTAVFSGDVAFINLQRGNITLNNFSANVSITGTGNTRTITLTNVQGTPDSNNSIAITGGPGVSSTGDMTTTVYSNTFTIEQKDTEAPKVAITGPSKSQVYAGESLTYTVTASDNIAVVLFNLQRGNITLNNFTANVSITGTGNTRTVTLSNIQGTVGGNKSIAVTGGPAIDAEGNISTTVYSNTFEIIEKAVEPEPEPTPDPEPTPNPEPKPEPEQPKPDDWIENPQTGKL